MATKKEEPMERQIRKEWSRIGHYEEAKAADNKTNSQSHMEPSG